MSNIDSLDAVIVKLNNKKKNIAEKLNKEQEEIINLEKLIQEYQLHTLSLKESVKKYNEELEMLNKTIEESEAGYRKIIQASETIMAIVSQNMEDD